MGCDIHGTIEVKQSNLGGGDGLWYTVVRLDSLLSRSYLHFAHLFGVRYYEDEQSIEARGYNGGMTPKKLYEGRGLPHDISDTTQQQYDEWSADAHSETYAYHEEVESAIEGTELGTSDGSVKTEKWIETVNISRLVHDLFEQCDYEDGQVRWVVWFDN